MRLIIAEKHSVGQAIAQAVGGHMEKHDGYEQVGDDLVTWAQGHLVDLAAPDEYKNTTGESGASTRCPSTRHPTGNGRSAGTRAQTASTRSSQD